LPTHGHLRPIARGDPETCSEPWRPSKNPV
jgi:hypothetical protein